MRRGGRIRSLIGPKRRVVQWLVTLVMLGIPFLQPGGVSLLRLDAGSRTLLFFGAAIRIEEFYLFLIAILIFVFGFLFVTMLFGRVWCGWFCPQTTLSDLAEWMDRNSSRIPVPALAFLARQLWYLILAALVAANLVWYFLTPAEFFARIGTGAIGMVAGISWASTFLLVYLDLALVRRTFCKSLCPYGRIQLLTMDRSTLTLEFDPAQQEVCLRCGACVKACPMGIDIRDGLQIECINCGRCLDACRSVMAVQEKNGLIRYTFGSAALGGGRPLNRRTLLLAGVIVLLGMLLAVGITARKQATLKVQRSASGEVKRLPDGSVVNFYTVYLENRATRAGSFSLALRALPGHRVELIGPIRDLTLPANANRRVDLAVKVTPAPAGRRELTIELLRAGKIVAEAALPLLVQ